MGGSNVLLEFLRLLCMLKKRRRCARGMLDGRVADRVSGQEGEGLLERGLWRGVGCV